MSRWLVLSLLLIAGGVAWIIVPGLKGRPPLATDTSQLQQEVSSLRTFTARMPRIPSDRSRQEIRDRVTQALAATRDMKTSIHRIQADLELEREDLRNKAAAADTQLMQLNEALNGLDAAVRVPGPRRAAAVERAVTATRAPTQTIRQIRLQPAAVDPARSSVTGTEALTRASSLEVQLAGLNEMLDGPDPGIAAANDDLDEFTRGVSEALDRLTRQLEDLQNSSQASAKAEPDIAGIVAILGGLSSMVLGWRRDHRERARLTRELEQLRQPITTNP